MTFETYLKPRDMGGNPIRYNEIRVSENRIAFGKEITQNNFGKRVKIKIDYDNNLIGFEFGYFDENESYKLQLTKNAVSGHISCKSLSKRITKDNYFPTYSDGMWIIKVKELVE